MSQNIPVSTQWTLDATGDSGRVAVSSVYMISCQKTASKGSSFLLQNGYVITNVHVIDGEDIQNIVATSASGQRINFTSCYYDSERDIAILKPSIQLIGGLELDLSESTKIGESVYTWGYPLGHNGPAPLLSVGYLSGFQAFLLGSGAIQKRLVVNGAFNSGNSGGGLFKANENKIIGIVVNKRIPILNQFQNNAIEALAKNGSGIVFAAKDSQGGEKTFVESQIVAQLLESFRGLVQIMIGEAICSTELVKVLMSVAVRLVGEANEYSEKQNNHGKAISLLLEAANLIEIFKPKDEIMMAIYYNLGNSYQKQFQWLKAQESFLKAQKICEGLATKEQVLRMITNRVQQCASFLQKPLSSLVIPNSVGMLNVSAVAVSNFNSTSILLSSSSSSLSCSSSVFRDTTVDVQLPLPAVLDIARLSISTDLKP